MCCTRDIRPLTYLRMCLWVYVPCRYTKKLPVASKVEVSYEACLRVTPHKPLQPDTHYAILLVNGAPVGRFDQDPKTITECGIQEDYLLFFKYAI